MKLEKGFLFKTYKDFLRFLVVCLFILSYSILIEFQNYKKLTNFDTALVTATVLKQYTKSKEDKTYQVLKLASEDGFVFFTSSKKDLPNIIGQKLTLEIYTAHIKFIDYLRYFYAYSYILDISKIQTMKQRLNNIIQNAHKNDDVANIYKALYTATPLTKELLNTFSALGVSHLLAISGFHLGVLSVLLLFLFKYPYSILQDKFFPYRSQTRDIFIIIVIILFLYLLFLDLPPSLLRAFSMLIVGFILYDRGIKIISMQTLSLTVIILISFFPRLFFSLGFWLSVSGVFYIFLFLINFKNIGKFWQFILVPIWVYIMMLPLSLYIFHNFSIYHPLSILWSMVFVVFYPLSIFLHIVGFGDLLDFLLLRFISFEYKTNFITFDYIDIIGIIILSLLAIKKRYFLWSIIFYDLFLLYRTL